MTENEAIEKIKDLSDMGFQSYRDAKKMAISALREIQQYREIGSVEECREAVDKQKSKKCAIDSCPDHTHYECPSCGKIQLSVYKSGFPRLGRITRYCENCGQALEESEEE